MGIDAPRRSGDLIAQRYRLVAPVEDHGVGEAWAAADGRFPDRPVVLKLLGGEPPSAAVMVRALDAVRRLRHPRVLPLMDHGAWEGGVFVAYEDAPRRSLGAWLDEHRARQTSPPLEALRVIFGDVCDAIAEGHRQRKPLLHDGISPAVVMLQEHEEGPRARVMDFCVAPYCELVDAPNGSARAVACVAPERFQGEATTPRSDQFSAALLLLEMLAISGESEGAGQGYRGRGDVPRAVWQALEPALRARPDERYEGVSAFAAAIDAAWEQADPAPPPEAPPEALPEAPSAERLEEIAPPSLDQTSPQRETAPSPPVEMPTLGAPTPSPPIAIRLYEDPPETPSPFEVTLRPKGEHAALFRDAREAVREEIAAAPPQQGAFIDQRLSEVGGTLRSNRDRQALLALSRRLRDEAALAESAPMVSASPPQVEAPPAMPAGRGAVWALRIGVALAAAALALFAALR